MVVKIPCVQQVERLESWSMAYNIVHLLLKVEMK